MYEIDELQCKLPSWIKRIRNCSSYKCDVFLSSKLELDRKLLSPLYSFRITIRNVLNFNYFVKTTVINTKNYITF